MHSEGINLRRAREIANCVYCGSVDDVQRDHVIPTSYLREKRRFEGDWLVPACGECNRTLGSELIFNVPDRAYWLFQAYKRKYHKLLKSVPWSDEELEEIGYALKLSIIEQERSRKWMNARLDHLMVTAVQPITFLAPLRPDIDPEIEDVPEFMVNSAYDMRGNRIDLREKARKKFKAKEIS